MKKTFTLALVAIAASIAVLSAAPVTIKLATLAPANTSWHKALLDMGDTWTKTTEGRVKLTVYAGGTQGDEPSALRMMRPGVDTLQAGLFTAGGLAQLDEGFNALAMPFFFESDEEELAVQNKISPILEQRLAAKGFRILNWGTGGWVQMFSKKPLKTLADVKGAKLFTSKGDDRTVQFYASNGFHPVALLPSDIPAQLKLSTGLIDTAPYPPYMALTLQIFRDAKYMLDLHAAPFVGATIISNDAWSKISADDQAKVIAAAKVMETRVRGEAPKQDVDSIAAMQARGLEVIKMDAKANAEFRTESTKFLASMRGNMVPADIYDMALAARDAFRKTKGK
ncbi:MAG: TRAP transporter substrate-binding protein DctP [Acidobacteriota bacterium]